MMQVRSARPEDAPGIGDIYNHYILHSDATWRWDAMGPEEVLSWVLSHGSPAHPMLVACEGEAVVGFACLSDFRPLIGYCKVAENTVYVRPGWEGRGVGRRLMERLVELARAAGLWHIVAVLDGGNAGSRAFHEALGFREAGALRDIGYKFGRAHDCLFLQLDLRTP